MFTISSTVSVVIMNKKVLELDARDAEDVCTAIGMRICQIETGTTTMRAVDAEAFNKTWQPRIPNGTRHRQGQQWVENPEKKVPIKALDRDQRELINRLEDIQAHLRKP